MTTPTLETIAAQAGVTPVGVYDGEIEYVTHCERGSFTVTVTNRPGVVKFFLHGSVFSAPGLDRVFYLPVTEAADMIAELIEP